MKPTYFDLTVRDLGQARTFFENVLGWRFEKFRMPYEYYRIHAGPETEPGIDGGIGAVKDTPLADGRPLTQVTVPVPRLDEALAKVLVAGGRVVEPKLAIPGVGWYATCAEPGGLLFGLIEADPDAHTTVRGTTLNKVRPNHRLKRSAEQRCCSVPVALRAPAPA